MNRTFGENTGNRNNVEGKLDFEGFLSPLVLQKFGEYMHSHRFLEDGTMRDSDNWQNHFGKNHQSVCMQSLWRHFHDMWLEHRGFKSRDGFEEAMMGALFNLMAIADKHYKDLNSKD